MSHRSMKFLAPAFLIITLTRCTETSAPTTTELCPNFEHFDSIMGQFMSAREIHAGALGVMKDSRIVYDKSFGWKDEAQQTTLLPGVMMRLASVTKPITGAAIRELESKELLDLDDYVFDLGQPEGGILDLDPFRSLGDTLLAKVTVRHLLLHHGGWDRDVVGDLAFREIRIAEAMEVPSPPGRIHTVRYVLGQPLQFPPGSKRAYSNIGYLMLGSVVEEVSGMDYLTYVLETVFDPIGVARGELIQGRTFPDDQNSREPWYDSDAMSKNVFDPAGPQVKTPYGGWDLESMISFGGLVASTRAILEFLDVYQVSGDDIGARRTGTESSTWRRNHTGSFSGTNTLARQRGDGVNYVVLFNKKPSTGGYYSSQIRGEIDDLLDQGLICWPRT
ncbi:MAG: beta-lactamase family protein [Gemmatimonadetes bacterium]|nr:beta-lactamase family protein [Gemmatimonadota bacterium]